MKDIFSGNPCDLTYSGYSGVVCVLSILSLLDGESLTEFLLQNRVEILSLRIL